MTTTRSEPPGRPRMVVVSGYGSHALNPRGQRTQRLVARLERDWDVQLIALPSETVGGRSAGAGRRPLWRRLGSDLLHRLLIDRWEPWAIRRLRRWEPRVDAALLIGYPWSPVTSAAGRLRRAGIPYVVDAGDPWALTGYLAPRRRGLTLAGWRGKRAERLLWRGAAGGIVTTRQQRDALARLFPSLPILVRPNGYDPASHDARPVAPGGERDRSRLRLVHFGMLSRARIDPVPFLASLVRSGRWRSIEWAQFGDDHAGMLERAPEAVEVERHAARSWLEVLAEAAEHDLALVVGNRSTSQLPSKAIQYLSLPIPRLAVTEERDEDALRDYVQGLPGWLVVGADDPDAARLVWEHLERDWSDQDLEAPAGEGWPEVADRASAFIAECLKRAGAVVPEGHASGSRQAVEVGGEA